MVEEQLNVPVLKSEEAIVDKNPQSLRREIKHKRPRVREISSRFMSPMSSASTVSTNDVHLFDNKSPLRKPQQQRASSTHRQRTQLDFEPLTETLIHSHSISSKAALLLASSTSSITTLKENEEGNSQRQALPTKLDSLELDCVEQQLQFSRPVLRHSNFTPSKPDTTVPTPIQRAGSLVRIIPSRFKTTTPVLANDKVNSSQEATNLPKADMLLPVSNRINNAISSKCMGSGTPISRSLGLPSSGSDESLFYSQNGVGKVAPSISKSFNNSLKTAGNGGLNLPPIPPNQKLGADVKKRKNVSSPQEDVHSLRMLHNHYLQWRFANARTQASMKAQKREAERSLYSLGIGMSDLNDSVKRKSVELGYLQRLKTLTTILETQMPYLEEWSALEGDFSLSISEATQALLNVSIQLPVRGSLRVDLRDVGEAFSTAEKMMGSIVSYALSFMPKAEKVESLTSELARITGGERALIEECGDLLIRTYNKQVEECHSRSHLMQVHRSSLQQS
ncbi:hypothetical protein ACFE04_030434 [Oxalis oulophora]